MTTKEKTWNEEAAELGQCAMESIAEMVTAMQCDYERLEELQETDPINDEEREELATLRDDAGECTSEEEALERIQEDPLSLQVRSEWVSLGDKMKPEEFELLLGTGGPAVRIIGDIDDGEPCSPRLEVQDWGKAWTEYRMADTEALEAYCAVFCFEI